MSDLLPVEAGPRAVMAPDDALASARFVALSEDDRQKALARAVEIINSRHARVPLSADDIYVHSAVMSTDALDSYWSRMHASSLRNFAEHAGDGRAFLHSHLTRNLPLGHTFEGAYEDTGTDRRANAGIYMLRASTLSGVSTDEMDRAIGAGTVRDVSVGFSGGKNICDVCGNDLRDWENCPHIPGTTYRTKDGVVATYTIHEATLRELSGVYEGATPGAMFSRAALDKAERGVFEKFIGAREVALLEDHYRMPLAAVRTHFSVPGDKSTTDKSTTKPDGKSTTLKETTQMRAKQLLDDCLVRFGARLSDDVRTAFEECRGTLTEESTDLKPVLDLVDRALGAGFAHAETVGAFRAAGVASLDDARALKRDAEAGRAYRADLIKDALDWGVKAQGETFPRTVYEDMLSGRSTEDIKALAAGWEKAARERLGGFDDKGNPTARGGRQTQPLHGFEGTGERRESRPVTGTARNYKTGGR